MPTTTKKPPRPVWESDYESDVIEDVYLVVADINDYYSHSTFVIKLLVLVFITYHFVKRSQNVCKIYFYILYVGYIIDISSMIVEFSYIICVTYRKLRCNYDLTSSIQETIMWYNVNFSAGWTLILTLNRYTAIVWYQKYDKIWTKHWVKAVILMLSYPFLLDGYTFINYKCRFFLKGCKNPEAFWEKDDLVTTVGNGICAVLSLLIAMVTALYYRKRIKKDVNVKQNPDRKLVFQALVQSFTYLFFSISMEFIEILDDGIDGRKAKVGVLYIALYFLHGIAFISYHLSAYVLLIVFSPSLRQQFFDFYFISKVHNVFKWQSSTTKVLPLTSTHTTSTSLASHKSSK